MRLVPAALAAALLLAGCATLPQQSAHPVAVTSVKPKPVARKPAVRKASFAQRFEAVWPSQR